MKYTGNIVLVTVSFIASILLFVFAEKNKEHEGRQKAMIVGGIFTLATALSVVAYTLMVHYNIS